MNQIVADAHPDDEAARIIAPSARDPTALRLTVTPSPADDERDAIIAALVVSLAFENATDDRSPPDQGSRWATAGRRCAMLGHDNGPRAGWGRADRNW